MVSQLNYASGILNNLDAFYAGDLVEKPPAARVHQHRVALQFEQLEHRNLLIIAQWVFGVLVEESLDLFRRAVKNDGYVVVARGPWIMKEHSGNLLIVGGTPIAQPVQCLPQSFSPLLIPGSVASAGIATAMAVPALYAVRATPCAVLDDLSFVSGRKLL